MQHHSAILILLCTLVIATNGLAQRRDVQRAMDHMTDYRESYAVEGRCYARWIDRQDYYEDHIRVPVFTGDPVLDLVDLQEVSVIIDSPITKWVKRKGDANCLSKDPDDCMIWCLVEEGGLVEVYQVLIDTTQTDEYHYQYVPATSETVGGWHEVLCHEQRTPEVIKQLQDALRASKHYKGPSSGVFTRKTLNALRRYQMDHDLHVGQLDLVTMERLGVK